MSTPLPDYELVKIEDIVRGDRYRTHPEKNLDTLVASIKDLGLLNPVVITQGMELVAGERRILAMLTLGHDEIEAHYVHDLDEAARLLGEHDENVCREPMTLGEARACAKARQEILKPIAEANSKRGKPTGGNGSQVSTETTRTRNKAAAGTGKSGKTIENANKIEEIANNPATPPEVAELAKTNLTLVDNDEKGVRPALAEVKEALDQAAATETGVVYRGQKAALTAAVTAYEKQAAALTTAFEGAENFDPDLTIDTVRDGLKVMRANFNHVVNLFKTIGA